MKAALCAWMVYFNGVLAYSTLEGDELYVLSVFPPLNQAAKKLPPFAYFFL